MKKSAIYSNSLPDNQKSYEALQQDFVVSLE